MTEFYTVVFEEIKGNSTRANRVNGYLETARDTILELREEYPEDFPARDIVIVSNNKVNTLGSITTKRDIFAPIVFALSAPFIMERSHEEIMDTILHEIAHIMANANGSKGHDWLWKSFARKIGATPERCKAVTLQASKKWKRVCPECGQEEFYARKPRANYFCGKCHDKGLKVAFEVVKVA